MYFVYILQSEKDGSFYAGQTADIEDRSQRHNEGRSKYTSLKRPWKLVYFEKFNTRAETIQRKKDIKRKKRKSYIEYIIACKDNK
jgi:putative endonuclease